MPFLAPNRSLLNPAFEAYKLDPLDEDHVVSRFPLPHALSQAAASGRTYLSFEEVQSRIRHNHLAVGQNGRTIYVDENLGVVIVDIDEALVPSIKRTYFFPSLESTEEVNNLRSPEYPSVAWVKDDTWVVTDGRGTVAILVAPSPQDESVDAKEIKRLHLPYPCRIHAAAPGEHNTVIILLSSVTHLEKSQNVSATPQSRQRENGIEFSLNALSVSLATGNEPPQSIWLGVGHDAPTFASYISTWNTFIVLGGSRFTTTPTQSEYKPSSDEIAPIPRANEVLDQPAAPPPFSWTQTDDSVTIAFPLPAATPKASINVTISPQALHFLVRGQDESNNFHATFWDTVRSQESLWTWDAAGSKMHGLLTVELEKSHPGTRWTQPFAPSAGQPEVAETLDPSQLAEIRDAMDKFTASAQNPGGDSSRLGLGDGVPGLSQGEMDEEVDLTIASNTFITWIPLDGSNKVKSEDTTPVQLLATPLPGYRSENALELVTKNGLDGLLFSLHHSDTINETWAHTATYSALAFVLASKRDVRFIAHAGKEGVLAFDSGARGLGGNLYRYRAPGKAAYGKQAIIRVGNASSGPLLGIGMVQNSVVLALCEKELVVLRNLM